MGLSAALSVLLVGFVLFLVALIDAEGRGTARVCLSAVGVCWTPGIAIELLRQAHKWSGTWATVFGRVSFLTGSLAFLVGVIALWASAGRQTPQDDANPPD